MTDIKPRNDYVLVKPEGAEEEVTEGGIHLPESMRDRPRRGTILAVGPGKYSTKSKRIPLDHSVGERIIYGKAAGISATVEGQNVALVRDQDILATLKD